MQIKTTIEISPQTRQNGHHQKNLQAINAGEGVEKRKCKLVQPLWRTVWKFLKKLKIERQERRWRKSKTRR